ncbi:MAG: hypothetical protein K6A44_01265 [bacterium]|nr:hypothetical protein [bacterium]
MKSIYDFTKIISVLFLLSGIGFIFTHAYFLAALGIGAFIIIRFIDSDWMFHTMQLDNPNSFVVTITFIVLCVYGFFVYQEMQYAPLLTQVKPEHKTAYLGYERNLAKAFATCSAAHNELMDKMDYGIDISDKEQKAANRACFNTASEIEKVQLPEGFPQSIAGIALKNKSEYKKAAINLSSYQYSEKAAQDGLVSRITTGVSNIKANIIKIRRTMSIDNTENEPVSVSVKL